MTTSVGRKQNPAGVRAQPLQAGCAAVGTLAVCAGGVCRCAACTGTVQHVLFMGGAGNGVSLAQWKANHSLLSGFRLLTSETFVYKCGFVVL